MGEWRLGSYELLRRLGEGGMAQVYLARDVRLGREVAVKVLDRKLAERPGFRERFMREARVAAALDHPNIVPLFDFGDAEALYLVMPYVSGGSLQDLLPRTPLPIGEVVTYGSQIADALEYAHQRKLVHRDVKPANMLVHADGRLMLSDFGLAKIVQGTHKLQAPRNRPDAGTPEYMAPEQVVGSSDSRSDIYGLGVVLYLLLTGRLPFSGSSSHDVMQAHLYKEPKPVRRYNPGVPAAMEAVVMRAMAKQPAERFQRASELGAALLSALIADNGDAPSFLLGGSSSHGGSRPTGQAPIVAPRKAEPGLLEGTPPWLVARSNQSVDPASASGRASASAEPNASSNWDGTRSSAASSLTGLLPELNMPFTSMATRGSADPSGLSATNNSLSFGSQGAGHSAIGGVMPTFGDGQAFDGGALGIPTARTLGQAPSQREGIPPASVQRQTFPPPRPAAPDIAPPPFMSGPVPSVQPMQPPMQPMRRSPYDAPPSPVMTSMPAAPVYYDGAVMTVPAPQAQQADLRATLPGSRMTEPPAPPHTRERNSMLWITIAVLLLIMLVAVIVLLRWLQSGATGFLLFALH